MFDFDTPINRRNTNSVKWDEAGDGLPFWVADMDFATAPCVSEAITKRASHPVYGYPSMPDSWAEAYINWWDRRHQFKIDKDWLIFTIGVIPILSSTVRKLTTPGEKVVIQTPVYNIFFNSVLNNGRQIIECPLIYNEGKPYEMDFVKLEEYLSDPQVTLMFLCNPQNPAGRIWKKDELARVGELCHKYNVTVVSDEIHCDLTEPGKDYIPFASVNEICRDISITAIAPTKTFNVAGIQSAAAVVPNPVLRHKVWRQLNTDEVAEGNVFSTVVAEAAFTEEGEIWLNELREYIESNKKFVTDYLSENLPEIKVTPSDATYLMWLNCKEIAEIAGFKNVDELQEYLRFECGVFLSVGSIYGSTGKDFLRFNVACPRCQLEEGLIRIREGILRQKG